MDQPRQTPARQTAQARVAAGVRLRVAAARLTVWIERLWGFVWWPLLATAAFAAAGLLGWLTLLGDPPRLALLALLAGLWVWALVRALRRIVWPGRRSGVRRVEEANDLPAGQLDALTDRLLNAAVPGARRLWHAHLRRTLPMLGRLRWPWPRLTVLERDRRGLVPLIVLLAALGLFVAGRQSGVRLDSAFSPWLGLPSSARVTAWITPPGYSRAAPMLVTLDARNTAAAAALPGGRLVVLVSGLDRAPMLRGPGVAQALRASGATDWRIDIPLSREGTYVVRLGLWRTLARVRIDMRRDGTPLVSLGAPPQQTASRALRIAYRVLDDYGATRGWLALRRGGETRVVDLGALEPARGQPVDLVAFADLTPHAWAGERVQLRVVVRDAAGNFGVSAPVALTLPERAFLNPLARAIIAIRKHLLGGPGRRVETIERLDGLSARTRMFTPSLTAYVALRSALWRLVHGVRDDPDGHAAGPVLWDTAIALEDGHAPQALADLRAAFDDMAEAVRRGSDQAKADQLQRLLQALGSYLNAQAENAMGLEPGTLPPEARAVDAQFLDDLMQSLRDRMAAGDVRGAMAALEALRQLSENVQVTAGMQGADGRQLDALRGLMGRQKDLLRESGGEQMRQTMMGAEGQTTTGSRSLAGMQQRLGGAVAELRRSLAQGSPAASSLQAAERAMAEAAAALGQGQASAAIPAQSQALDRLGAAGDALARDLARAAGARAGMPGSGLDPLGRLSGQGSTGMDGMALPSGAARDEVARIRRMLEQRAADPRRSDAERAYLLRLLKRF